jgi:hypothetical protein
MYIYFSLCVLYVDILEEKPSQYKQCSQQLNQTLAIEIFNINKRVKILKVCRYTSQSAISHSTS